MAILSLSVLLAACQEDENLSPVPGMGGSAPGSMTVTGSGSQGSTDPSDGGSNRNKSDASAPDGATDGATDENKPLGFGNPCTKNGVDGLWSSDGECCMDGCLDGVYALCQHKTCTDSLDCQDATQCGFGTWCANCDDSNPCTDDVCTKDGCAHLPWTTGKSCTTFNNEPGNCTVDDFGPNPTGVCCPTGTCLDVVNNNIVCVTKCSDGKSCSATFGDCE